MLLAPLLALALASPADRPALAAATWVDGPATTSTGVSSNAGPRRAGWSAPASPRAGLAIVSPAAADARPIAARLARTSPVERSTLDATHELLARTSPVERPLAELLARTSPVERPTVDATHADPLASASPADPPPPTTIEAALVRADGLALADVERALRVRLPSLTLVQQGEDMPQGPGLRAFVDLRRGSPTQVQIALILSDGRAYFRVVDAEDQQPARPVAAALALLIAAIEDDSVAPDQRDVPVPPAIAEPPPAAVPSDMPIKTCPKISPCPKPPAPPAPPAPPPPPALELGLVRHDGASLGLGSPLAGIRGAVFGLGLDLRWRRGAIAAAELRATLAPVDRHTLTRIRGAVGAGFGVRVRAFEMPVVAMFGLEWWGLPGADAQVLGASGGRTRPLLGGGLRLSPGFWLRLPAVSLRAGVRAELWASGEPGSGGLRKPVLARPGQPPLAAVGGVELNFGLEIAVWFDPGRRKRLRTGPNGHVR